MQPKMRRTLAVKRRRPCRRNTRPGSSACRTSGLQNMDYESSEVICIISFLLKLISIIFFSECQLSSSPLAQSYTELTLLHASPRRRSSRRISGSQRDNGLQTTSFDSESVHARAITAKPPFCAVHPLIMMVLGPAWTRGRLPCQAHWPIKPSRNHSDRQHRPLLSVMFSFVVSRLLISFPHPRASECSRPGLGLFYLLSRHDQDTITHSTR
jgi:hypothetical protein